MPTRQAKHWVKLNALQLTIIGMVFTILAGGIKYVVEDALFKQQIRSDVGDIKHNQWQNFGTNSKAHDSICKLLKTDFDSILKMKRDIYILKVTKQDKKSISVKDLSKN